MNAILEQINSAGGFFVEFAVPMLAQSSVLIAILLLADFLLRKKIRAVFRYWLWMLVLVKLVLPSSLSSPMSVGYWFGDVVGSVKVGSPPAFVNPVSVPQAKEAGPIKMIGPAPLMTPKMQEAAVEPVASLTPVTWQGVVFLVWLAVVGMMAMLLLQRAIFVSGLVAQAKNANNLMNDALKFCCRRMAVNGKIGLKVSANATSPAVCGLFRPVILVPENLAPSLGAGHLRTVLLHELAHIKRGDLWVNLFQTILQIIYFYNPLLWLANAVIRRVREQAVDEAVQVAMGERARQYPETLVDVAKLAFKQPVLSLRLIGVVESRSTLQARIKRMLHRPIPKTAKLGILGLIIVLIFAAVLLPMAKAENLTHQARKVMKLAEQEARQLNHEYIGTEHILLALVQDGRGVPVAILKNLDVDIEKVHLEVDRLVKSGPDKVRKRKLPQTPRAKRAMEYAVEEAKALNHNYVGTEHILLGLLRVREGIAAQVLVNLGLKLQDVRQEVLNQLRPMDKTDVEVDYSSVTVEEGVGFNNIIFGCTGDFIKSKLGEPDRELHNEKDRWLNYRKTYGLGFWVNPQEDYLIEIRLNPGFKGKLSSGISMSSTKKDVFDVYGEPVTEIATSEFDERYDNQVLLKKQRFIGRPKISKIYYNQHGLLFWFKDDKINQIVVYRKESKVTGQIEVDITPADFDIRLDEKRGICNLVVSIQNQNNVNIPKFKLRFYRGNPENNLDETGNVHTGWHEAGPIEPGKSWNECTRDFHLPDGQYEFHAVLDYDDNVPESDENNNRAVLQVKMSKNQIVEKLVTSAGNLKDLNVLKAEPKVISDREVEATAKETLLRKLQILQEQQQRLERDLAMAERALDDVRARFGITDLEERGYPHPITARLTRLQKEQDDCVLEISQLRANIENLERQKRDYAPPSEELKKAKADLLILQHKCESLEKIVQQAKAEKANLDRARSQYQQRVSIRDERKEMLNNIKAHIEKLRIMYDEAESSILEKEPEAAKRLKIIVYEAGKQEPEITLNIPLTALKIANGLLPPKVKTQMLAQGINLGEILRQVDEGIEPTTLLDVKDGTEHIIISLE